MSKFDKIAHNLLAKKVSKFNKVAHYLLQRRDGDPDCAPSALIEACLFDTNRTDRYVLLNKMDQLTLMHLSFATTLLAKLSLMGRVFSMTDRCITSL